MVTQYVAGQRVSMQRNPFYWKTDPEGNQLPFINQIESIEGLDEEVALLKVASGEVDAEWRGAGDARESPSSRNTRRMETIGSWAGKMGATASSR